MKILTSLFSSILMMLVSFQALAQQGPGGGGPTPLPEPGALALLGVGAAAAAIVWMRGRNKKK